MSKNSERPDEKSGDSASSLPGGLPLFTSGWGAGNIKFSDEATFWEKANRLLAEGQLAGSLDEAMAGHSSPRVWLFLHEPGQSDLSLATALNFARELAHRDQSVLLLDGDDENADLTRLAGRNDIDGWIDLVRYGSSVLTCGIPMPFDGRRGYLLGVGSFTPADVTALEVKDLLGRLKRQADDVLITAPADSVGRLWAAEADIRLLCWDRAERSASLVNNLLESFEGVGIPLTGLVGFGLPRDESKDAKVIPVPAMDDSPDDLNAEIVEKKEIEPTASEVLNELAEQEEDLVDEEEFARRKGNSGVFWLVVVVSIILISAAGGYYYKYVKVPEGGYFPVVAQEPASTEHPVGHSTDEPAETLPVDNNETIASQDTVLAEDETAKLVPEDGNDQIKVDKPVPIVAESAVEVVPQNTLFGMLPYTGAVGSAGWTLHVYSFPDSVRAKKECEVLAAKGFRSQTRAVHFKDKGRWFRIYLGSFATKSEANAARKSLMNKLGEDWANPVRF